MSLDTQRDALELRDTLEYEIAERIRRNNVLRPHTNRPRKEVMLQRHEIRLMAEATRKQCEAVFRASAHTVGTISEFEKELEAIQEQYQGIQYTKNLAHDYAMYLSARDTQSPKRRKRKDILLKIFAPFIDLEILYTPAEKYGTVLDLVPLHRRFRLNVPYVEFLATAEKGTDAYISAMRDYLVNFLARASPLENVDEIIAAIPGPPDQTYCSECGKWFKSTVYASHLVGKKHRQALKNPKHHLKMAPSATIVDHLWNGALKDAVDATKADAERTMAMTDRERMLEITQLTGIDSDYTDIELESSDSDGDEDLFHNLPIGPNGRPIQHWLYKLQGLHKLFSCEVCGNAVYQGRQAFDRHFDQPKHIYGLKCLGVSEEDYKLFGSITQIEEATNLLAKLHPQVEVQSELEVEMEDDDGNVLSRADYEELKAQGLI